MNYMSNILQRVKVFVKLLEETSLICFVLEKF